jgi:hypothetical protein
MTLDQAALIVWAEREGHVADRRDLPRASEGCGNREIEGISSVDQEH